MTRRLSDHDQRQREYAYTERVYSQHKEPAMITVEILEFTPRVSNTLQGFAKIRLKEVRLIIHDVAIHQKNLARWAQLPSKAQIGKDRELIKKGDKIQYAQVMEFDTPEVRERFSARVIAALDAYLERSPLSDTLLSP